MITRTTAQRYVLDSFAVLAYLKREPGGPDVRAILRSAKRGRVAVWLSVINLGEVLYIIEREDGPEAARAALGLIEQLPIRLVDANRAETLRAARVKAHHRLSHADAFAVSLARELGAAVVTGDPEFHAVDKLAAVHWLPSGGGSG